MSDTPMMQQFREAKAAHPDALLLFRMGDFYELFHDDASTAARVLGLTLTSRDKGENPVPMAGFPHHALESYLGKLVAAGHRVAICDQVEDPRQAKGLVRREVTRVVSPGTLTDETLLDPRTSNYLAALVPQNDRFGLAWVELSTGKFVAADLATNEVGDELGRLEPAECLIPERDARNAVPNDFFVSNGMALTTRPPWCFARAQCRETLLRHFGTGTLEGFDLDETSPSISAAGAILEYLGETQKTSLEHIARLEPFRRGEAMILDEATRRGLELGRTLRDGRREAALLGVLDETATPMGARLLAEWLANPMTDRAAIAARHEAVGEFASEPMLCRDLKTLLGKAYDLERLTTRVSTGRASPRDLGCLGRTLALLPKLKAKLTARRSPLLVELETGLDLCEDVRNDLNAVLVDEPPLPVREGGIVRSGFDEKLDELRELTRGGKQWIAAYQTSEIQRTGIASLKVGFNKVFGYYLEVTHAHAEKIPDDYIRKQTLKNAERYVTPELKEHEERVLQAEEQARDLEYDVFVALRDRVAAHRLRLQQTAGILATVDVLGCLGRLAAERNYCCPEMVEEPELVIENGRHPVLDHLTAQGEFVPNDTNLTPGERHLLLITGPNMAGKSTYIRQVALIVLMAQMGSWVPARRARIGISDRIFARIGASDELSRGQSTFMVEMTEAARILNAATERSLVILDEIGRGTSTYDGISLAWAMVEHLHNHLLCRTLFATHYHELTELARNLPGVRNLNVAVREWDDHIVFLHKIVEGAADKSYGIHVARLAGVPKTVVERAKDVLASLENHHLDGKQPLLSDGAKNRQADRQLSLFSHAEHPLLEEIRKLDLDHMTPLEALARIQEWQKDVADPADG